MCGIFGITSYKKVDLGNLLEGLSLLEYRGYDSAGISFISNSKLDTIKIKGKISDLKMKIDNIHKINIGIGHTRWSTHGAPSVNNAHPHSNGHISIVHNGIIENANQLKFYLLEESEVQFISETDSEVILHLIDYHIKQGLSHFEAIRKTINSLQGSFAIAVIFEDLPDKIIVAKKHSPLVIGYGSQVFFISSDAYSISKYTNHVSYLEDGDIAIVSQEKTEIFDTKNKKVERSKVKISSNHDIQDKGHFKHYMHKEIYEQPISSNRVIENYINDGNIINIPDIDFSKFKKIYITACGTSYFSGMVAKFWLEEISQIPVDIQIASEVNYGYLPIEDNSLGIFISQSGETADTISALRLWEKHKQKSLSIVNVQDSTISRETDFSLPLYAGHEIGVASTKVFTNQLLVLSIIALKVACDKQSISHDIINSYIESLKEVPGHIAAILNRDYEYKKIASSLSNAENILYIGKGAAFAIALEGALKLKEVSYIHAEAIMSGELKHGSIALIDKKMHVVALMPEDKNFNKSLSNIQTVLARNGQILLISNTRGHDLIGEHCKDSIIINKMNDIITPIIYNIPLQILAYHVGVLKGYNVDQPRNLAKSVTVE